MLNSFIAIEGNIGAGKTTLTRLLAKKLSAQLILEEFAENPFLPKFYDHPDRYAFQLELFFLADRYHQLTRTLSSPDLFNQMTLSDYFIGKSLIFAKSNLEGDEYQLFNNLYRIMYSSLPKPDLLVYLYLPVQQLMTNIKKRGREYEQGIKAEYLEKIQQQYFDFLKQQLNISVLVLNLEKIKFIDENTHIDRLIKMIDRKYPAGLNFIDFPDS